MGIDVLLQVIHLGLLVVAQIAHSEVPLLARMPIDGKQLAYGGGRDEGGRYDIVIVVASCEDLVVRLSVIGTEHDTYQWHRHL